MQAVDFTGEGVVKGKGNRSFRGPIVRYKSRVGVALELLIGVLLVLAIAAAVQS